MDRECSVSFCGSARSLSISGRLHYPVQLFYVKAKPNGSGLPEKSLPTSRGNEQAIIWHCFKKMDSKLICMKLTWIRGQCRTLGKWTFP